MDSKKVNNFSVQIFHLQFLVIHTRIINFCNFFNIKMEFFLNHTNTIEFMSL